MVVLGGALAYPVVAGNVWPSSVSGGIVFSSCPPENSSPSPPNMLA